MSSDSAPMRYSSKKLFTPGSEKFDENLLSSKSSQEPAELLPRRTRNRGIALSIKEVRMVAESLRKSNKDRSSVEIGSARKEILESGSSVQKPKKMSNESPELPEKYETLIQFFNALVNSIRLSKLRLTTPLFTNLRMKIKVLTERNFTYHHLAQLKYIFPEAIDLKKMMVMDEVTYCTKPNLHISLNADAIEITRDNNMNLQKIFRSRLLEFIKTHHEGDEVPEESLPEPFGKLQSSCSLPAQTSTENDGILKPISLHLSQSFKQRFSTNLARTLMEKNHVQSEVSVKFPPAQENFSSLGTPIKANFSIQSTSSLMETPIKEIDNPNSTPAKLASTPVQTLAEIRASQPTKRSLNIPKDDSENSLNKLVRRPPRSRSLQFSEEDNGMRQKDGTSYNGDVLDVLSDSLLQSIREKEQKLIEEKDPAISLAKRRRKIMENLPKRFDTIQHLFKSLNRSVMTKQELVYKIVTNCSDIVDRVEAEEELAILIELAPEWIMEKSASTGDVIIRIKKSSYADEIRKRLTNAK